MGFIMRIKQYQLRVLFWCCVIIVFILSGLPGSSTKLIAIQNIDKVAHFVTFFVLSILLLLAYDFKYPYLWTTILMVLFGLTIEVMHLYIPDRVFSMADFAADVCGILAAFIAYKLFNKNFDLLD